MASNRKKTFSAIAVALVFEGALAGCANDWLKKLGGADADQGVPLAEFQAKDGSYFPSFVMNFFPSAKDFLKQYPTIDQARQDLTLIEIKQLNSAETRFNEANLSWSADGVYLGFEVITDGFRKIMLKDLAGNYARDLQMIPKGQDNFLDGMVLKSAQSYNAGLRWSRDSTRFAFMSNGGIGEYNIYVGAIGSHEKPVTKSPTKDGYATWSPATNEIAFVSGRTGNGDIYLVDLKSKDLTRLSASDAVDIFPEWFPSGNRLVYASGDALNHDLFTVSRESRTSPWKKPVALTRSAHDQLRPTVSPDGRYVAYYADAGDAGGDGLHKWNIYVVPFEAGKTYEDGELRGMAIADDVVIDLNTGPAWSPDSRKIFYVKRDPTVFNPIYGYDLFAGRSYMFKTKTRMNRDILMSKLGVLSFRAQVGVWDRVFVALTNQGTQLQGESRLKTKIRYLKL